MHVLIVGAGVMGLVCATELIDRGMRVTIVDRSKTLCEDACSWSAGGMLGPWCESESAETPVVTLGLQAASWWQRHVDCCVRNGTLVLAHGRDSSDLRRFSNCTERHRFVNAAEVEHLEPDLAGRFQQGLFFDDEAHLDPRCALNQLAAYITSRGSELLLEADGKSGTIPADITIDCRGLAARDQLPDLRGVRGEMLLLKTAEIQLRRPVRLLHPRTPLYVVPRAGNIYMIGATMIESDKRRKVSVRSVLELLGGVFSLHPSFGEAEVIEVGADVRPAFPDNLPRVHRRGSMLFVNGLYRHGFLLAPALAKIVAEAIIDPNYESELIHETLDKWQPA